MLWYKQPASVWEQALPIGNGQLGAMVFGRVANERLQINADSLWSGGFRQRNNPDVKGHLSSIRQLMSQGNIQEMEYVHKY